MSQAITYAKLYNDSLLYYFDQQVDATPAMVHHCDSIYHSHISMYWQHHNAYSHDNSCDDHYHDNMGMHNHDGNGTGHHDGGGMNHDGGMCCGGNNDMHDCHMGYEHSTIDSIEDVHTPLDTTWDKSSVSVEGECVHDSAACFTIYNTGDPGEGDIDGTSEWRLYENNVLIQSGTFQIAGGDNQVLCFTANGGTLRLEADQRPGHPGNS